MSPELYQTVFKEWIENPYIPLKYVLHYELYKVCLWTLPFPDGVPTTSGQVRAWLAQDTTFQQFKKELCLLKAKHGLHINIDALRKQEWISHVAINDVIVAMKYDWLKGGCITLRYDWLKPRTRDDLVSDWLKRGTLDVEVLWHFIKT